MERMEEGERCNEWGSVRGRGIWEKGKWCEVWENWEGGNRGRVGEGEGMGTGEAVVGWGD